MIIIKKQLRNYSKKKEFQNKILTSLFESKNEPQILKQIANGCYAILELTTERSVYDERGKLVGFIDVYIELKIGETIYPVICELKTNTDNHGNQLDNYFCYIQKEKGKEPFCFYITLNGKAPQKTRGSKYIDKYIPMSYWNVLGGCLDEQYDCCDPLIVDYLRTLDAYYHCIVSLDEETSSVRYETEAEERKNNAEKKLFYYAYFQCIVNEIMKCLSNENFQVKLCLTVTAIDDSQKEYSVSDLDSTDKEKIESIKLTIADPCRDYAKIFIERIFADEDKYVLGIDSNSKYFGDKGLKIYGELILHWKRYGKKVIRYKERSKGGSDWKTFRNRKGDDWNIAQLLENKNTHLSTGQPFKNERSENYNFKALLDRKIILLGFSDPEIWAEWLIADLRRIKTLT